MTLLELVRNLQDVGVELDTPELYRERAKEVIRNLASKGFRFTADDVREIAGPPPGNANCFGPIMQEAVRAGTIKRVGYDKARRARSRSRILSVYVGAAK